MIKRAISMLSGTKQLLIDAWSDHYSGVASPEEKIIQQTTQYSEKKVLTYISRILRLSTPNHQMKVGQFEFHYHHKVIAYWLRKQHFFIVEAEVLLALSTLGMRGNTCLHIFVHMTAVQSIMYINLLTLKHQIAFHIRMKYTIHLYQIAETLNVQMC